MGLECVHFAGLRGDQFIQGTQAVGDFLLLRPDRSGNLNPKERILTDIEETVTSCATGDMPLELFPVCVCFKAVLEKTI